jgi:hypothetical protein
VFVLAGACLSFPDRLYRSKIISDPSKFPTNRDSFRYDTPKNTIEQFKLFLSSLKFQYLEIIMVVRYS